jgi:hypothetical protein
MVKSCLPPTWGPLIQQIFDEYVEMAIIGELNGAGDPIIRELNSEFQVASGIMMLE